MISHANICLRHRGEGEGGRGETMTTTAAAKTTTSPLIACSRTLLSTPYISIIYTNMCVFASTTGAISIPQTSEVCPQSGVLIRCNSTFYTVCECIYMLFSHILISIHCRRLQIMCTYYMYKQNALNSHGLCVYVGTVYAIIRDDVISISSLFLSLSALAQTKAK